MQKKKKTQKKKIQINLIMLIKKNIIKKKFLIHIIQKYMNPKGPMMKVVLSSIRMNIIQEKNKLIILKKKMMNQISKKMRIKKKLDYHKMKKMKKKKKMDYLKD